MTGEDPDSSEAGLDGFPSQISGVNDAARDPIELLLSEFVDRQRQGENITVEQFARQHPRYAEQILELFPMVAAMEHWKSRKETGLVRQWLARDFVNQQVGDYRLRQEIGRGGMGIVFEAVHEKTKLPVAIKLLTWRSTQDSRYRRRFAREVQTATALKHSQIIPVIGCGEWDGIPYYVMRFVDGVGLDRIIGALRTPPGEVDVENPAILRAQPSTGDSSGDYSHVAIIKPPTAPAAAPSHPSRRVLRRDSWKLFARIALQAAEGLKYAHGQRIIHRDVKPGNILLDRTGRTWITDFGLAAPLDANKDEQSRDLSGTFRYMAPERFEGICDERCDVYGLGVTLYELVTLGTPLAPGLLLGRPTPERLEEPILPSSVSRQIPADLEAIVMQSVAPDRNRRYATASDFAADLKRFLNDQPSTAPRIGLWKRMSEHRRYRKLLSGSRHD